MSKYALDLEKYAVLARQAQAEGCVLLENRDKTLPLRDGDKIAVFGRAAFNYYKSGLGSGGLVNTRYVVSILDALRACGSITVDEELLSIYEEWMKENPYDEGAGWGDVPWSQKEMPVTDEMVEHAKIADAAIINIGRTAGEDQDNKAEEGAYLLSETEKDLIKKVAAANPRTIVLLNVGNVIDMKWVAECGPQAVMYVWQGGQEGGNGVLDVLTGKVSPCGKLTDTIACDITDYPSTKNFGNADTNIYEEDIYVGYRYFETFARNKVLYPFGYGLSYTTFAMKSSLSVEDAAVMVDVIISNTGEVPGKEVVQVYVKAPTGSLGQPARKLIAYKKTKELAPGESEKIKFVIDKYLFASYDDSGITGTKSCYVLEAGVYEIYAGSDVRHAVLAGKYKEDFMVLERLQEASAPVIPFKRLKAGETSNAYEMLYEDAPLRTVDMQKRMEESRGPALAYTGDKGYKLVDVLDKKVSMNEFVAQLDDASLIHMFRGEGMCSTKVTPGTAGAFGGVTDTLQSFGIPAACCADGPSGIRMDCGTKAFSLPTGTLLGCTYNTELVEALYEMEGQELRLNKIDSLLGPGMNIHRNPLNGRNFEYISEDPIVTGYCSAAQIRGMAKHGIGSTIKHFCGNNQEFSRRFSDAVISERALREIYLKGFEIAVRQGQARSVMTTYGSVNGLWTAGCYDLCTTILRDEWGFEGIVMTDWWAEANYPGQKSDKTAKAPMASAQNDIYMCVSGKVETNPERDDMEAALADGRITRYDLQRNAKNILNYILKSPAILHKAGRIDPEELDEMNKKGDNEFSMAELIFYNVDEEDQIVIDGSELNPRSGNSDVFGIVVEKMGRYSITFEMKSELGVLAQLPITIYYDNAMKNMISVQGSEGKDIIKTVSLGAIAGNNHFIKLYYGANGLDIHRVIIKLEAEMTLEEIFGAAAGLAE